MVKTETEQDDVKTIKGSSVLFDASKFKPLDPTQEPIFPAALKLDGPPLPLAIKGPRVSWYRPSTLDQLLELRYRFPHEEKRDKPQNKMVAGNTAICTSILHFCYRLSLIISRGVNFKIAYSARPFVKSISFHRIRFANYSTSL